LEGELCGCLILRQHAWKPTSQDAARLASLTDRTGGV
jgi:hypothetical protein